MLYELLSGQVPYQSAFETGDPLVMQMALKEEPESLEEISAKENAILLKAFSKDKDNRFENCSAFIQAFENALNEISSEESKSEKVEAVKTAVSKNDVKVEVIQKVESQKPNEKHVKEPFKVSPEEIGKKTSWFFVLLSIVIINILIDS